MKNYAIMGLACTMLAGCFVVKAPDLPTEVAKEMETPVRVYFAGIAPEKMTVIDKDGKRYEVPLLVETGTTILANLLQMLPWAGQVVTITGALASHENQVEQHKPVHLPSRRSSQINTGAPGVPPGTGQVSFPAH